MTAPLLFLIHVGPGGRRRKPTHILYIVIVLILSCDSFLVFYIILSCTQQYIRLIIRCLQYIRLQLQYCVALYSIHVVSSYVVYVLLNQRHISNANDGRSGLDYKQCCSHHIFSSCGGDINNASTSYIIQ